jgi:hypothetical protein
MKPSSTQLRLMKRQCLAWPIQLADVPREDWPKDGDLKRIGLMRSRQFLVQVYQEPKGIIRLSVNRTEWDERQGRWREDITWDDLQRLKAEAGYGDRFAMELFPADDEVVNVANMRHVWIVNGVPSFAWVKQRKAIAA